MAEAKAKIGAPSKGEEKKIQMTISVQRKVINELGVDEIRRICGNIINIAYGQKTKAGNEGV